MFSVEQLVVNVLWREVQSSFTSNEDGTVSELRETAVIRSLRTLTDVANKLSDRRKYGIESVLPVQLIDCWISDTRFCNLFPFLTVNFDAFALLVMWGLGNVNFKGGSITFQRDVFRFISNHVGLPALVECERSAIRNLE